MKDKTGRDLEPGQLVDLFAEGMLTAVVVKIEEPGLIESGGRRMNSILIVQVGIPFELEPGAQAPVYITKQADPARLGEKKGPRRVN